VILCARRLAPEPQGAAGVHPPRGAAPRRRAAGQAAEACGLVPHAVVPRGAVGRAASGVSVPGAAAGARGGVEGCVLPSSRRIQMYACVSISDLTYPPAADPEPTNTSDALRKRVFTDALCYTEEEGTETIVGGAGNRLVRCLPFARFNRFTDRRRALHPERDPPALQPDDDTHGRDDGLLLWAGRAAARGLG
jgi:hypothetical protein